MEVFTKTEKPKSAKKSSKGTISPVKPQKAQQFLQELLKNEAEIIHDRHQLRTVLDKTKHSDLFTQAIGTLLDFPTFEIKTKLIKIFGSVSNLNLIFATNLASYLPKILALENLNQKLGMTENEEKKKDQGFIDMMKSLGSLIQKICESNENHGVEVALSLTMPFINKVYHHPELEETVSLLMTECFLSKQLLTSFEDKDSLRALKMYLKLQKSMH